jgi:hypothetical protein
MILALGGRCIDCGTTSNLTFDCIRPTGGGHHKLSSVNRISYYIRQMAAGNLALRCADCNTKKGAKILGRYDAAKISPATLREFSVWLADLKKVLELTEWEGGEGR